MSQQLFQLIKLGHTVHIIHIKKPPSPFDDGGFIPEQVLTKRYYLRIY
jgi:hypothetical protein